MTTPIEIPEPPVAEPDPKPSFQDQLRALINANSLEGVSNTPDFILANYLFDCLAAFNAAVDARESWYSTPGTEHGVKR